MRARRLGLLAVGVAAALVAQRSASADDPVVIRVFGSAAEPAFGEVAWGPPGPEGDLDGDGHPDLLTRADPELVRAFSGKTGVKIRDFTVAEAPYKFGSSMAFFPDLDGDQVPEVLVGMSGTGDSRMPPGKVFVLSGATGAELRRGQGVNAQGRFGEVAISLGDVTGDGIPDFAAGGGGTTGNAPGEYAAFSGADGAEITYLRRSGTYTDNLGRSMLALGDVNGDGVPDFAVGSPGANRPPPGVAGINRGRVELVSGADGTILKAKKGKFAAFGYGVHPAGDLNRDGVPDLLVSGNSWAEVGVYSGRNLSRLGAVPSPEPPRVFYALQEHAGGGDADRDGLPDVVTSLFNTNGSRIEVHSAAGLTRGPIFRLDRPIADFIETHALIPDADGDGIADLLVSSIEGEVRIYRVVPTLPPAFTFTVPLTRFQADTAVNSRGTFTVRVVGGTQTVVVSTTGVTPGTTYTAHLEDAPGTGAFTQIGTLALVPKGASLELVGNTTPPAALGVTSLSDLVGRVVDIRDDQGATVVSAVIPYLGKLPAVSAKLPLLVDPASPFPGATGKLVLKLTPKTGALRFEVKVKGVPAGTPLELHVEDPAGSGNFSNNGPFVGTKYTRDTGLGEPLPLRAASVGDLSGRRIRVVRVLPSEAVVLEGRIP